MTANRKKILYIITQSEFGGAQRYVFDLATRLKDEFEIIVAAGPPASLGEALRAGEPAGGKLFKYLQSNDIRCHYLKNLKRAINPWRDILAFFELRRLIKKEKPDIIHLNSSKAGVLGSLAAKFQASRLKFQVIYTANGWVFNEPMNRLKKEFYLWAEKWTAKYKNKIICVSEYDRQVALGRDFPAEKLIIIHNGIDIDKLNFLDREEAKKKLLSKIPPSPPFVKGGLEKAPPFVKGGLGGILIGTIANLYPTKGIKYLIKAAGIITNRSSLTSNLLFIVIGEGTERPKLKALIRKHNLKNNFLLLGHIPDASQYLKAFDIFVLPSVKEGLPYVILEATACGVPIVATRVGGVPEIIEDNQNGLLAEPKNSQELAEKIAYLLQNQCIWHKLSETARTAIREKFSIEKMIQNTRKVYLP